MSDERTMSLSLLYYPSSWYTPLQRHRLADTRVVWVSHLRGSRRFNTETPVLVLAHCSKGFTYGPTYREHNFLVYLIVQDLFRGTK